MNRLVYSIFLFALLAGCGWQLKGSGGLPEELRNVYLDYSGGYDVVDALVAEEVEARLIRRGARVNRYPVDGASRLRIRHPRTDDRTQSVSADGDEAEFEVITAVRFSLEVNGEERIPEQTVTTRRDYSFRSSEQLSKRDERQRLQDDMQRELADLVMLQLESRLSGR